MITQDVWNRIAIFESTDLVKRYYSRKHNRELNSDKATQIASHFFQGREYFRTSNLSSESVRPLLQYYGILSLARGLILFLDSRITESGLKPSHGVSSLNWFQQLAQGKGDITKLGVRIENSGTFSQVAKVIGTKHFYRPTAQFGTSDIRINCDFSNMASGNLSLEDIISRIPALREIYRESFDRRPNNFSTIFHTMPGGIGYVTGLPADFYGIVEEQEARKILNLDSRFTAEATTELLGFLQPAPVMSFTIHSSMYDSETPLPYLESEDNGELSIIKPFNENTRLPYLSRLYLLSYFLGMLVRYNPTLWVSIVRRQSNNSIYPLLDKALQVIETDFPKIILKYLE